MTSGVAKVAESIAIIGMSGRFPKARNLDEFWRNLRDGVEGVSFFSEEESLASGADPEMLKDPSFVRAGAVLEDIDLFDASFFGFSARDAEIMDPQQRISLECAVHSLEDAGYNPETYPGMIGVFGGASMNSYIFDLSSNSELSAKLDDFQVQIGNEKDHLTTQVSYRLNLRGPSMAIQTACSTSLVAVCMACQSVLNYQCDMALAGGVFAESSTKRGYFYQPGGILSPDGHCRAFDAAAKGTVAGNGVAFVVLKRLSEAIADRDHIRAVIKGFALNNDGSHKVGYTAPSIEGQAQVIAMAQAMARVEPDTISYIEAHGTATELGDPIEIAALCQAFQAGTKRKQFCAIGSVKSNIGHLDAAAGVASLIKTVLALEHKALPPSLHFTRPNPKIDFENSPFYVNAKLSEWTSGDGPRRAGVSSFGIGGTNAHVIVEEAPVPVRSPHSRPCSVLKLSARSSSALEAMTDNLSGYLDLHPDIDLAQVAYTCEVGRRAFKHRRVVVCNSLDPGAAREVLAERDPQKMFSAVCEPKQRPVFFMFPGQGTQHVDMGLAVYQTEQVFREQVDRCAEILRPHLGLDLRDRLYPGIEGREDAASVLGRTVLTQPALFTIEYALAKLWMEWGIRPAGMIGHSSGEYVAACLAGVLTLEDALAVVAWRGQLMEEMPAGGMLAVPLSEVAVQRYLNDGLSLAAVNGPASTVLAGSQEAVDRLAEQFAQSGIQTQRLRTSHAFHSSLMDGAVVRFVERVRSVKLRAPQIRFQSNVTGEWITGDAAVDPDYWGKQLRHTVRFADGLRQVCETPDCVLLEVGPGQTLSNLARQQPVGAPRPVVLPSLSSGSDRQADLSTLFGAWGRLWLYGVEGDGNGFYAQEQRRRVALPGYPFERQRYWIEPPETEPHETADDAGEFAAARNIADWFYYPCWRPAMPTEAVVESEDGGKRRWLVFAEQSGLSPKLIRLLRDRGEHVTSVVVGEEFARLEADTYVLRPQASADYEALLREEIPRGFPDAIVHLWGVTPPNGQLPGGDLFERCQLLGFHSLVQLVQALEKHYAANPIRVTVVSNQTQMVTGREPLCAAKTTVFGASKVIPQEYPHIRCQSVDIDLYEATPEDESRVAGNLLDELTAAPFQPVVAWRQGRRWIQSFEAVRLDETAEEAPRLRSRGVYLITGGLGQIGLVLAGYLARAAQAKLVLTGRSEFPSRNDWRQWLRTHPASPVSAKIRRLLELEELGAEIMIAQADAADLNAMRRVITEAEDRFGKLHGVIHGAGNTENISPVTQTSAAAADQQFRPKAAGLMVLHELMRGKDLDFVLLLSSLSSVLGGLNLAAYSAANIFLDAFACERNREGVVPWISVNWDAWQFSDGEDSEAAGILPEEGEEAFGRILARAPRQIIVSVSDLETRLNNWIRIEPGPPIPQTQPATPGLAPQHARPNLTVAYAPAKSPEESTLVEIWQQLLGVAPVGIFDSFFDLGGHSLLAIQLISRIREAFRMEFPLHKVFEAPTIAELARSIMEARGTEDAARTAQLLDLVEQLSESEIAALLEQDGAEPKVKTSDV
jgi:acyl transferase domain-containing protein